MLSCALLRTPDWTSARVMQRPLESQSTPTDGGAAAQPNGAADASPGMTDASSASSTAQSDAAQSKSSPTSAALPSSESADPLAALVPMFVPPPEDEGRIYEDTDWRHWKDNNVPLLYDWFSHRNLEWPSSTALWGPVLKTYPGYMTQRLYYSERTGETDFLNTLILAQVTVPRLGISSRELLGKFSNERGAKYGNSGKLQVDKRIVHPGERSPGYCSTTRKGISLWQERQRKRKERPSFSPSPACTPLGGPFSPRNRYWLHLNPPMAMLVYLYEFAGFARMTALIDCQVRSMRSARASSWRGGW